MYAAQNAVSRFLWVWIATIITIISVWLWKADLAVDITFMSDLIWVSAVCLAVIFTYRYHRDDNLRLFGHTILQICCLGIPLGILSYISNRFNLPLIDDSLIAMDRFLGFDWLRYVEMVNGLPVILTKILRFSYNAPIVETVLFVCLCFAYRYSAHGQRFVFAFFFCATVTIILAAIFPAVAGYVYYDISSDQFKNVNPAAARIHEDFIMGMRNHTHTGVTFPITGLVTFPSFHSALAVLLIYASLPFKKLRIIAIPLSILTLFATPAHGGHYLIDVIAGIANAFIAIFLVGRILPGPLDAQTVKRTV